MIVTAGVEELVNQIGPGILIVIKAAQCTPALLPHKLQFWTLREGEVICEWDEGHVIFRAKVNYQGPTYRLYVNYDTPCEFTVCLPEEW